MTQLPARGVVRTFRLTNEPGGLGLSCTPAGLSLAGLPLLRRTQAGFVPRPASEIASLLKVAFGDDPTGLRSRLGAITQALNSGDFAKAMIAAVHTRTPELSKEAALRLANADEAATKYSYNPDEPRDWHGRWTRDGSAGPTPPTARGEGSDGSEDPTPLKQPSEGEYDHLEPVDVAMGGMTSCVALSRTHALLNVRNRVFQRITMAGSSSTV